MKLYEFEFERDKVNVTEMEVKETAKCYTVLDASWRKRYDKTELNRVCGYSGNKVLLDENDFEKAKAIYLAHLQKRLLDKKEEVKRLEKEYERACELEVNKNV